MVEFPKQDLSLFLNKKLNSKGKEALWQLVPGSSDNGYSFLTEKAVIGLGSVSEQAPIPEPSWFSLTAELPLYHHTHLPKAKYILGGRRALDREPWTESPGPFQGLQSTIPGMQGDLQLLPELFNAGGISGSSGTTAVLGWSRARVKTPFPGHGAPCPSPRGKSGKKVLLPHGRAAGMSLGRQGGAEPWLRDQHSTRDGGGGFMAGPWERNAIITAQLWKLGALHHPAAKETGSAL